MRRARSLYVGLHLVVLAAFAAFPLYRFFTDRLPAFWLKCFLHDRLFFYCPFCGGTRALEAMLRFDFAEAFTANPWVVLLIAFALVLDVVMFVRFLRRKTPLLPFPHWTWILLLVLTVVYGILRNWLMIAYGYDPLGDLGIFWNH